jgi:transcriptional regulator with XRE-family HTH domain
MYLADQLRQLRESKKLSQGDIQIRSGLLRCYISRVENGHTVPALETLEKIARALEVPLYQLFYESRPVSDAPPATKNAKEDWASRGKGFRMFRRIRNAVARLDNRDRRLLIQFAVKLSAEAGRNGKAL